MSGRHNEPTCFGCPLKSVYTEMVNMPLDPASGELANENIWVKVSEDQRLQQELGKSGFYVFIWLNYCIHTILWGVITKSYLNRIAVYFDHRH